DMIDQLAEDVKGTIQELRELVHGIYPPLLADSGLGEALRAAGQRSPQPVRAGGRVGGLLLLPGGTTERRQARAGSTGRGAALGRVRRLAVLGRRRRSGLRRRARQGWPWVCEHGGPAGCHRRRNSLGVTARRGFADPGLGAAAVTFG